MYYINLLRRSFPPQNIPWNLRLFVFCIHIPRTWASCARTRASIPTKKGTAQRLPCGPGSGYLLICWGCTSSLYNVATFAYTKDWTGRVREGICVYQYAWTRLPHCLQRTYTYSFLYSCRRFGSYLVAQMLELLKMRDLLRLWRDLLRLCCYLRSSSQFPSVFSMPNDFDPLIQSHFLKLRKRVVELSA